MYDKKGINEIIDTITFLVSTLRPPWSIGMIKDVELQVIR